MLPVLIELFISSPASPDVLSLPASLTSFGVKWRVQIKICYKEATNLEEAASGPPSNGDGMLLGLTALSRSLHCSRSDRNRGNTSSLLPKTTVYIWQVLNLLEKQDRTLDPTLALSPADIPFSSAAWSEVPCRAATKPSRHAAILHTPASSQEANGSPPSSRWQFSFKSKWQKALLESEEGVCSAPQWQHRQPHSPALNVHDLH